MVGFGGGGEVLNLWKKVFVRAAVTSASNTGSRAFLLDVGLVSTNVPVEVSITTTELSAGWRQTLRKHPRFSFYGGGGLLIANYKETSSFAQAADDSTLGSNGYSLFAGMEAVVWKYVIAGVEGQYKSIGDVLGEGGLSKAYSEDNLGGAAIRGMVGVRFMRKK
jgi:opacity protein-like surface antigen